MHADTDVHMGHLGPLARGERSELSGLRVDPGEHLTDDKVVGLLERQGRQPGHDRTQQLAGRVGERFVHGTCRCHACVRRGSGHPDLVSRLYQGSRERQHRPEVVVVAHSTRTCPGSHPSSISTRPAGASTQEIPVASSFDARAAREQVTHDLTIRCTARGTLPLCSRPAPGCRTDPAY